MAAVQLSITPSTTSLMPAIRNQGPLTSLFRAMGRSTCPGASAVVADGLMSQCPVTRSGSCPAEARVLRNTTIYSLNDRYRGIKKGRQVIFLNPDDLAELGIADGDFVNITVNGTMTQIAPWRTSV